MTEKSRYTLPNFIKIECNINMKIFIVGSGKLANAILDADLSFQSCEVVKWNSNYKTLNEKAIVVHAGSGRQLEECLAFCSSTKSVFIELSTGSATEKTAHDFPFIICPNTSILVLKTLHIIKANSRFFENYEISISESHQSAKETEPGTAFLFANSLKFPIEQIESIRDPQIQLNQIRIPEKYLNKHAYHKICIKDGEDELTIETKVLGHKSYVNGVKKILETVLNYKLENRNYTVLELIDKGII
jgi:4-hydroxy-tetrahydrodipicolinate reductase